MFGTIPKGYYVGLTKAYQSIVEAGDNSFLRLNFGKHALM